MLAKDVMTETVISVCSDDTIEQAVQLMIRNNVSGLPVVDRQGRLQGMVTEGDLLRRTELSTERSRPRWIQFLMSPGRLAEEYVHTHGRKVAEVMTANVFTVAENASLEEIVSLMEQQQIKRVPVLRDGNLVGIVSRANVIRALAKNFDAQLNATDQTIHDSLLSELKKQKWTPRETLDVNVREGVVELRGCILDERERQAIIVAAENTAGVKRVVDHLVFVEPMSGMVFAPPEEEQTLPKAS
ncbi:MAG: CBS domain-containing protein [Variibacter sp.]